MKGAASPQGLAQLGPHDDGSGDPVGDILPFPLGHGGDHRGEKPAGRGTGVDGFLEGDQVGVVILEVIGA